MIDKYLNYHINRIIKATNDLYNDPNSICKKCHDKESINCILCYCPRYEMGTECGGNFTILDNCVKDCSNCTIPHDSLYVTEWLKNKLSN